MHDNNFESFIFTPNLLSRCKPRNAKDQISFRNAKIKQNKNKLPTQTFDIITLILNLMI